MFGAPGSRLMDLPNTLPVGDIHYTARGNINNNLLKVWAALWAVIASPYSSNLLYLSTRLWLELLHNVVLKYSYFLRRLLLKHELKGHCEFVKLPVTVWKHKTGCVQCALTSTNRRTGEVKIKNIFTPHSVVTVSLPLNFEKKSSNLLLCNFFFFFFF